jgi:hypothetical protein
MKIRITAVVDFHGDVTPAQAGHLVKVSIEDCTWPTAEKQSSQSTGFEVDPWLEVTELHAEEVK